MSSGPTQLIGPQHYRDMNGHWYHTVRQSDINRFRQCPELHRRHLQEGLADWQNDSAAIGSALGIFLLEALTHGDGNVAAEAAHRSLEEMWASPNLREVQIFGGLPEAHAYLDHLIDTFIAELWNNYPAQEIVGVEVPFKHVVHKDSKRTIFIQGTRDLDTRTGITDWKSSDKAYSGRDAWKHQRYDVQPVMYVWARAIESSGDIVPFEYIVIHRDPQGPKDNKRLIDSLTIDVTEGDIDFLKDEIIRICKLVEAELDQWPLGPTDWHCSSKWCRAWSTCRGKYLGDDPWGLMANVEIKVKERQSNPFRGFPTGQETE